MAQDPDKKNDTDLPPKLDLRKQGIIKNGGSKPEAMTPEDAAPKEGATSPAPIEAGQTQTTVRIKIPDEPAKPAAPAAPAPPAAAQSDAPKPRPAIRIAQPGDATKPSGAIRIGKPAAPAPPAQPSSDAVKPVTISAPKPPAEAKDEKSKTSRVPLEEATVLPQPEGSPVTPKTIRIKPKDAPGTTADLASLNKLGQAEEPPAAGEQSAEANKRKTSRISLEAALASEDGATPAGAPASGGPKTIRLKRPSEASTVKVQQKPGDAAAGDDKTGDDSKAAMGKTARLDEIPVDDEGPTPTRRKTIRVKRPTARATVSAAPAAAAAPIARGPAGSGAATTTDECHWVFSLFTGLSIVVLVAVIWMFAAQAIGGLVCGTQTSWWVKGPNLYWPGKITSR